MKIDTAKIEGYENMSAEEKLAALEEFEYDDNAAELERIRAQLSKANAQAAASKREMNTQKSADDEKIAGLQERLDELEKRDRVNSARARLLGLGVDEIAVGSMAEALADAKLTDENADAFFAGLKKHIDGVAKKAKSDAMTGAKEPQGGGSGDGGGMTLEQFRKLSAEERVKYSCENPADYEKLYGGN